MPEEQLTSVEISEYVERILNLEQIHVEKLEKDHVCPRSTSSKTKEETGKITALLQKGEYALAQEETIKYVNLNIPEEFRKSDLKSLHNIVFRRELHERLIHYDYNPGCASRGLVEKSLSFLYGPRVWYGDLV